MSEYYGYLCSILEPLHLYALDRGTMSGSELYAAGQALDEAAGALEHAECEGILPLAEGEGLTRREKLFSHIGASPTTALRREAVAALMRISTDGFTLEAINAAIGGCGVHAVAEETERYGVVRVRFPDTAGVPDGFDRIERIVLDIMPCHLLTEFYFRYLTWRECEQQGFTWQSVEDAQHTWESFQKAVPV